jgi:hypothetical protein
MHLHPTEEAFVQVVGKQRDFMQEYTDGESTDAVEQYFWGMTGGVSLELGALDGSLQSQSMTALLAAYLGWTRLLIEGNPSYRQGLRDLSPDAFSASAVICSQPSQVHYINQSYTGGVVEFMSLEFLRAYQSPLYDALRDKQDSRSINWSAVSPSFASKVLPLPCLPLSAILHEANVTYINFFILDVEGGELDVLKTINWSTTKFDVLCIETDKNHRPPHYPANVTTYLSLHGYRPHPPTQMGRNTWFIRDDFTPSRRNGTTPMCFNGVQRSLPNAVLCEGSVGGMYRDTGTDGSGSGSGSKRGGKSGSSKSGGKGTSKGKRPAKKTKSVA